MTLDTAREHVENAPQPSEGPRVAALAALFFISGGCALVYQVLWLRLLGLVFGVTIHAATTVLASFMGGLAVGSLIAGRLAPRVRHPLRWFGAAEILIGIAALATQPALRAVTDLYVTLYPSLADAPGAVTLLRFVGASVVLLVPTALMGASLPLVLQSALARHPRIGSRFAVLYSSNTAGAIAGTLLVGFVLIGRVGIATSFQIAALGNLLVGATAIALSRAGHAKTAPAKDRIQPAGTDVRTYEEAPERDDHPGYAGPNFRSDTRSAPNFSAADKRIVLVFAISGFAALAFEVVWFRLLVLFVPATTYAFSTMLAAVLFGIAAGSALVAPLLRRTSEDRRILAYVEMSIGLAAMLSLIALAATYRAASMTATIPASLLTIAPATILMGLAFPIGVRLLTRDGEGGAGQASAKVAMLYAVNVGAAIVGATVTGFLLIPTIGTVPSLVAVAGLHVVAGFLLVDWRARRALATAALVSVAFIALALALPDPVTTVIGERYPPGERVWWREEGAQSTVSVHVRPAAGRMVMYLDGLHQANDSQDMVRVHREIGLLPMALHPHPRRALVIGLGAGATAGAVSQHDGTDVTVVELSPSVVRAAAHFDHINDDVTSQPSVRIIVNDARNHLLVTDDRYDVITADIIQPIHAGAGNLYSREYFSLVRRALAEDGLALQWVGHREATQYRLIVRTFMEVFPHTTAWLNASLLVGSLAPLEIDTAAFARKLQNPRTREALEAVNLGSVDALLGAYTAGSDELRAFVGSGPLLTDDHPRIEFFGSLPSGEPAIDVSPLRGDVHRHVVNRDGSR
jgi:spermidine synthase